MIALAVRKDEVPRKSEGINPFLEALPIYHLLKLPLGKTWKVFGGKQGDYGVGEQHKAGIQVRKRSSIRLS